ncbi:hypothetical protein DFJ73DRAFT_917788 [Zopfochytrium polystomum]|nr:hypothetical protein DFJ73DRAFT_917788 [Zopfochytrium polystomum]
MTKPNAKAVSDAEEKQQSIGPPKDPKSPSVDALKKESAPPKAKTKPKAGSSPVEELEDEGEITPAIDWSGIGPEAFMNVMKTMHSSINEAMQREESPTLSSLHKRSDQELADDSLVEEYISTKDDLPGLESGDQTGLFLFNTATSSWETNVKTLNIGAAPQVVQIPPRPSSTSTQPRSPTTTSKVTTVSPTKSPSPTVTETHRVSKLTPGAITAIVLGGLLAAVLAAVAACFVIYRRKNRNADGTQQSVAAVAKELKKELMERIKKTGERRPILGAAVKSKKPKWKKPQKRSDAPSETSSTRSSDSPVPVIKEPDLEIRGLSFLPPGYKLPPPPNMRPPAAAPAADESSPLLEPPSIARSNSRSSLLSHAEVAAADDDHPVVPSNIPPVATGPAKRLGLYRYVDLAKNAIIPVLAPIQEVYENPWSSGATTTTTTTTTDTTSSAPPAPASSSPTPHRQKVGDITALSTEFENALYDVIGDLGRIPLTDAGAGQLGLELASMPLRTISLDAADPAVGYEVSSALQTEIRFQCVYYHNAKKSDEMNVQKFYSDGWARGVNVTQDTDGMFPIFYVEEATEAGYVESSGFGEVTPELEGYNAFESMIDK